MACARLTVKAADDAGGGAVQFAANEAGGGGEFVGKGFDAGVKLESVGIAAAAVVAQRLHTGDTNAEIHQALTPRTAEAVADKHGNGKAGVFFEFTMKLARGAVGIFRKQHRVAATINVRDVNSAVGAEEAVVSFGDEHAVSASDDGFALALSEFDYMRVEIVFPGPGARLRGGVNRRQLNQAAFGLRDHLVFDDENVAGAEVETLRAQREEKYSGQGVAAFNFARNKQGDNTELLR